MKYDRIQEMLRYITPGLFLMALILLIHFEELIEDKTLLETVKGFEAIIIALMPFVGFVLGYLIECMMTWVERGLYCARISRPSRKVLHGKSELYKLDEKYADAILDGELVNDNKTANKFQQIAKQEVGDNDLVNRYYYQSIMRVVVVPLGVFPYFFSDTSVLLVSSELRLYEVSICRVRKEDHVSLE